MKKLGKGRENIRILFKVEGNGDSIIEVIRRVLMKKRVNGKVVFRGIEREKGRRKSNKKSKIG